MTEDELEARLEKLVRDAQAGGLSALHVVTTLDRVAEAARIALGYG